MYPQISTILTLSLVVKFVGVVVLAVTERLLTLLGVIFGILKIVI
jgi:hypothetical protein